MQKIPEIPRKNEKRKQQVLIGLLCLAFFGAGVSVPLLLNRNSQTQSSEMDKLQTVYELMKDRWYYADTLDNPEQDLIEQAITGMTMQPEDLHTNYLSLDQAQQFTQVLSGSNVGIGIVFFMNEDGNIQVRDVFVNSTSDKAGLKAGDIITSIDGKNAQDMTSDDLVSYIKSRDGQKISAHVIRSGEEMDVDLTPGSYDSTVSMKILNDKTGEVGLTSFSEVSGKEFADALGRMRKEGVTDLIIDLRDNTGGYLSAALDIAGSLLPKDSDVFVEVDKNGNEKVYKASSNYTQVPFEHIYVLQNGNSASASEVLIGALKDNLPEDMVTTIGQTTYGKGTEQVTTPFADGTSLKYTIAEWKTPNGTSINKTGFEPDVAADPHIVSSVRYQAFDEGEVIEPDSVHANAEAVQKYLQYLGYDADRTDSYFSPASSEALKKFQEEAGLEATGEVDQETFDALSDQVILKYNQNRDQEDETMKTAIELAGQN